MPDPNAFRVEHCTSSARTVSEDSDVSLAHHIHRASEAHVMARTRQARRETEELLGGTSIA
jgi:hypothetical protein